MVRRNNSQHAVAMGIGQAWRRPRRQLRMMHNNRVTASAVRDALRQNRGQLPGLGADSIDPAAASRQWVQARVAACRQPKRLHPTDLGQPPTNLAM